MVFVMVLLGGATRLSGSGLSMTEWQPLTVLPPMSQEAWQEAFAGYKASPEYTHKTFGMSLEDFKGIFWLEFIHRNWGRLIGVVVALPLVWFAVTGRIDRSLVWRMAGLFVLGGLQGGVGWLMVKSGLQDRPEVSQYRLAAHLGLAVLLYMALLWTVLTLDRPGLPLGRAGRRVLAFTALVFLTMVSGAFVAGLDAGLVYNTFPLMDGHLIPTDLGRMDPWWINMFENVTTVQFDHRVLATTTFASALLLVGTTVRPARRPGGCLAVRRAGTAVLAAVVLQVSLGIATLLLAVPLPLGVLHQAGALLVIGTTLWLADTLREDVDHAG